MQNTVETPQQLQTEVPGDPAGSLLGTYPEKAKLTPGGGVRPTFPAASFTVASTEAEAEAPGLWPPDAKS